MKTDGGEKVLLAHGSGGRLTQELIRSRFSPALSNPILDRMEDSATIEAQGRLAFTIDSHVVSPLFFPGGDIGRLSITGTVNDLAMAGARPLYISAGFIIEEGLGHKELARVVSSMSGAAAEARVDVVAGDTKVVERGAADGLFITTSGIGIIPDGVRLSASAVCPGDAVIVSGTIGDHGVAILSRRQGMDFEAPVSSDCAPLNDLVEVMLGASGKIHALRDPTRGGLAAILNEIATASSVAIEVDEGLIPYRSEVRAACELLGLDPMVLANEGKLVAFVAEQDAGKVLRAMKAHDHGTEAAVIGRVEKADRPRVYVRTLLGSRRVLAMPSGEQLPRIC
jgi:hydrogenase expression/formation protein HypE